MRWNFKKMAWPTGRKKQKLSDLYCFDLNTICVKLPGSCVGLFSYT